MNKQNFLTRMLLLFALIVGSVNGVWAVDIVFDFQQDTEKYGWSGTPANKTDLSVNDVFTNGDVTFTYTAKGSGNTNLRWWSTGDGLRSYNGNKFAIATSSGKIKSITFEGTCVLKEASETGGTIESNRNWTAPAEGNITEVEFTCNQSSGAKTIKKVTVTVVSSDPSSNLSFANKNPEISFPTENTYSQAPTTATGYSGTITYEMTSNTAGATINTTTGEITVTKAGKVIVKATAAAVPGSFSDSNDSYTLTVNDERPASGIAWSSSEEVLIEKNAGSYDLPTLTNPHSVDVSYEITGTAGLASESAGVITVDTSIEGTATITANYVGGEYKPCSVSYNITVYDPTVKGTINNPYTVADVININPTDNSETDYPSVYVKGYVVGVANTGGVSPGSLIDGVSNYVDTNIAIADDPTNTTDYCLVQLQKGDIRTALNVKGHPGHIGVAQVLVRGDILKYCNKPGVKNLTEGVKVAEMVKITSAGLATYVSDDALDYTGKSISAYIAKEEAGKIKMYQVNIVPAGTGVLLKANGEATVDIPVTTEATDDVTGNLFKRGNGEAVADGTNPYNYILNKIGGTVGFYRANDKIVDKNRAYLQTTIDAPANGRLSIFFDDEAGEATGIIEVKDVKAADAIFNLNGVRVKNMTKGLYIVNGKKMIVK